MGWIGDSGEVDWELAAIELESFVPAIGMGEASVLAFAIDLLETKVAQPPDAKLERHKIERAILAGSLAALHEIDRESPLAIWSLDEAMHEYSGENILLHAIKFAPPGADAEIVDFLSSRGARLPSKGICLVLGSCWMGQEQQLAAKPAAACHSLMERCGYLFSMADAWAAAAQALLAPQRGSHQLMEALDWAELICAKLDSSAGAPVDADWFEHEFVGRWGAKGRLRSSEALASSRKKLAGSGSMTLGHWIGFLLPTFGALPGDEVFERFDAMGLESGACEAALDSGWVLASRALSLREKRLLSGSGELAVVGSPVHRRL